ncbi:MAG: tetratricopeptide repeat protein [Anaerolineae bacterium]|nr:tetratricopeptide repeat protein [Anaerolineae bacterium]
MKETAQTINDLIAAGDIKKADVLLAKTLRNDLSDDERVELLVLRARVRLLSERPEDALDDIATATTLDPHTEYAPHILELKAECYFARFEMAVPGFADRADTQRAVELYQRILQSHPSYANVGWIYYQLGRISVTANIIDEALQYFHQALLNPSSVRALTAYCYERLGFIAYYEQRDLEKALAFLNRAIDTYPADENRRWLVQVHILKSRILRATGDTEGALRSIDLALAALSGADTKVASAEVLLAAGEIYAEMPGRDRDVIGYLQQFTQAAKRPPGVDVTWSRVNEMLGNAFFNLGQYENAVSAYQSALNFNPDHPWALSLYYRIARSHYQQRMYQSVVDTIREMEQVAVAEAQSIEDYRVYDILGNALFALRRYEQAVEAYGQALRIAPTNAENLSKIKSYYDLARELI